MWMLQVILGLLCPCYIPKLEFKFKEELQLMPHTEEEHLFSLEEENEDAKGQLADNYHNMGANDEVRTAVNIRYYHDNK
jgi:hypothetical protein